MPFSASAAFVCLFHPFPIGKTFLFEDFFFFLIQGNKQTKSCFGQGLVNREGGAQGSCWFWSKTAKQSARGVGRYAHKSPVMKGGNPLEESSKEIH